MDEATNAANNNPPPPSNSSNTNDGNLRVTVDSLVSVIKDKRDELDAKNNQIRDLMTRLERVNQRLGEKDTTIDELKQKLSYAVPELIDEKIPEGCVFPAEIFDEIFGHCSAATRINFASTNSFFHKRYHQWKDVTSLYITRQPVKEHPKATIIPQAYLIRTNSPAVSSFSSTNLIAMAASLPRVKNLLIESMRNGVSTAFNRIPIQSGLFSHFQRLEFVKICNVGTNLSIRYNLNELLALPRLKILHIREHRTDFTLPAAQEIQAPLEQLRISIAYRNPEKLESFLEALSPTLTSLDFSTLRSFLPFNSNVGGELIPAITAKCAALEELHIPNIVSRHASFDASLPLLRKLTNLKRISFEMMHLSQLVHIIDNLPPSCEYMIVTDIFYIRGETILLSSGSTLAYDKMFSGDNYEILQFECNRIHRKFTIQLGRFRGFSPLTLVRKITQSLQMISNATNQHPPKMQFSSEERQVYLWDGVVMSREEFLSRIGILPLAD